MENMAPFEEGGRGAVVWIGARACVLKGFALPHVDELLQELAAILGLQRINLTFRKAG